MLILVVDDSTSIRMVTRCVLERADWKVLEASSASTALSMLQGINCILTDYNMPGMNGIEMVRIIRTRHYFMPIVMMTTDNSLKRQQEAQDAGITAWLIKPYMPDELIQVVQKVTGTS